MATTEPKVIEPHEGGCLDHIRTAIFALQLASELTRDEAKIKECREVIEQLQTLLAQHARRRDAAIGTGPRLPHVDVPRSSRRLDPAPGMPILREVPPSFKPLPPDDPIFTLGPSLVFRSDLPHGYDEEERDDDPDREDAED
jgi:hypothetical protein